MGTIWPGGITGGNNRDRIVAWKRGIDAYYNQMEDGRGNRYKYDPEGQLERAWYRAQNPETENPVDPKRGDEFHCDELGNRAGWNDIASRGHTWIVRRDNGLNQYTSWANNHPNPPQHWGSPILSDDNFGGSWVFPGNGVTMADGWIVASYNALNQPVAIGCTGYGNNYMWFGFDPLGRCVKRWTGPANAGTYGYTPATFFSYDGWNMVQEGTTAAAADRVYVHGGRVDEIVASQVSGAWYNHHYDAQGNCLLLSTATGAIQEQYDYDAFGYPYFYTPSGGNPATVRTRFLFTGREWISELRVYDYRARQYQPELGRFLQPDPKQFEAGDYNLYRYCHNDPVNKSDPFGLRFTDAPPEEVDSIAGQFGETKFQLNATVGVAGSAGHYMLRMDRFDVRAIYKHIATHANGRLRSESAKEATVKHENLHSKIMEQWHNDNQNNVPKDVYGTPRAAEKAAIEAASKLNRDFGKIERDTKLRHEHVPDKIWKDILWKEKH